MPEETSGEEGCLSWPLRLYGALQRSHPPLRPPQHTDRHRARVFAPVQLESLLGLLKIATRSAFLLKRLVSGCRLLPLASYSRYVKGRTVSKWRCSAWSKKKDSLLTLHIELMSCQTPGQQPRCAVGGAPQPRRAIGPSGRTRRGGPRAMRHAGSMARQLAGHEIGRLAGPLPKYLSPHCFPSPNPALPSSLSPPPPRPLLPSPCSSSLLSEVLFVGPVPHPPSTRESGYGAPVNRSTAQLGAGLAGSLGVADPRPWPAPRPATRDPRPATPGDSAQVTTPWSPSAGPWSLPARPGSVTTALASSPDAQ
jgi:hypothetical protein